MEHVKLLIEAISSHLEGMARTKTVVGDPVEVQGKTLIPLIELSIGFGGGGFAGEGEGGGLNEKGQEGKGKGEAKGGGTGGGMKIAPVAVLCIEPSGVSGFSVGGRKGPFDKAAELLPQLFEKLKPTKAGEGGKAEPSAQ